MARPAGGKSGAGIQFQVKGLRELDRALGRANKGLRTNLRAAFRDVAGDVATVARGIAESKGLRDSGDMIRSIRPFALQGRAGVRSGATHGGFSYPSRHEFEGRRGAPWGPRASLNPAVEASEPQIRRGIEHVLETIGKDFEK
jgi:hypothetical protein